MHVYFRPPETRLHRFCYTRVGYLARDTLIRLKSGLKVHLQRVSRSWYIPTSIWIILVSVNSICRIVYSSLSHFLRPCNIYLCDWWRSAYAFPRVKNRILWRNIISFLLGKCDDSNVASCLSLYPSDRNKSSLFYVFREQTGDEKGFDRDGNFLVRIASFRDTFSVLRPTFVKRYIHIF